MIERSLRNTTQTQYFQREGQAFKNYDGQQEKHRWLTTPRISENLQLLKDYYVISTFKESLL